jgi:hypothetical protein
MTHRLIALALASVVLVVLSFGAGAAQSPLPTEGSPSPSVAPLAVTQLCISVVGETPVEGWNPVSLQQALASGAAFIADVADPTVCSPVSPSPWLSAPPTLPPTPVATPTPLLPPLSPMDVTYHEQHTRGSGFPGTTTYTITWRESETSGVEIRVSGLTKCLSNVMDEPCIQRHMTLPIGTLKLIARAPASNGSISWTWPTPEVLGGALASDGTTDYYAFLVGAYSIGGQSRLVIVKSATACPGCVY